MSMTPPAEHPPLAPDDPRISEWIDGRLSAGEAVEIERAVAESPSLTRLVADLRSIKEAARMTRGVSPPAGFTDRVMAALAAGAGGEDADRAVDDEWRAIEAERIAVERAEAAADREDAVQERSEATAGRRWPWLALAGALAAGFLVALVLDRRPGAGRDVAMVARSAAAPRRRALEPPPAVEVASNRAESRADADASRGSGAGAGATSVVASLDPQRAAAPEAAATEKRAVEQADVVDIQGGPALAAKNRDEDVARRTTTPAARERLAAPGFGQPGAPPSPPGEAADGGSQTAAAEVITVVVGSPRERTELIARLRALEAADKVANKGSGGPGDQLAEGRGASAPIEEQEDVAAAPREADGIVEVVGDPDAIRAVLDELRRAGVAVETARAGDDPTLPATAAEAAQAAPAATNPRRILIRIVEEPAAGERSQP